MTIAEKLADRYGITVEKLLADVLYLASISGKQRSFVKWTMRQSNK